MQKIDLNTVFPPLLATKGDDVYSPDFEGAEFTQGHMNSEDGAILFTYTFRDSWGNVFFKILCIDNLNLSELSPEQWEETSFDIEINTASDVWSLEDTLKAIQIASKLFAPIAKRFGK